MKLFGDRMATEDLILASKPIAMRRSVRAPAWGDEKVLTSDIWTYVDLWLRRNVKAKPPLFYWEQAREFYKASLGLPTTASPLTLYYCFLNATKALLSAKAVNFADQHGLTGDAISNKASLSNEQVTLKQHGVLPSLMTYYGEVFQNDTYSLRDMLGNLAFVHRAYCLSYKAPWMFFSLSDCHYVKGVGITKAWLSAQLEDRYNDQRVLATLPPGFEVDIGIPEAFTIRKKQRFPWKAGRAEVAANIGQITNYHHKLRRDVTYIAGTGQWYLKRRRAGATNIDRHAPCLIYACMHRLSELSRYNPLRLSSLLDTHRNWLLTEFIKTAPLQFIDEIACEMTGQEIHVPGIHTANLLTP